MSIIRRRCNYKPEATPKTLLGRGVSMPTLLQAGHLPLESAPLPLSCNLPAHPHHRELAPIELRLIVAFENA